MPRSLRTTPLTSIRPSYGTERLRTSTSGWRGLGGNPPPAANGKVTTVTYHEACHLCHGQKITAQPRQLLRAIPNLKLVELPESTWCCGSAGIYNLIQPEMAGDLLDRKIKHIKSTGAPAVATGNPGCLLQLINGAKKQGVALRV